MFFNNWHISWFFIEIKVKYVRSLINITLQKGTNLKSVKTKTKSILFNASDVPAYEIFLFSEHPLRFPRCFCKKRTQHKKGIVISLCCQSSYLTVFVQEWHLSFVQNTWVHLQFEFISRRIRFCVLIKWCVCVGRGCWSFFF